MRRHVHRHRGSFCSPRELVAHDASISKLYTVGYALSKMMPGLEVMHQFVRNLSLAEPRNLDQILMIDKLKLG